MSRTYVLSTNYDGDVTILAAGNDLERLRKRLRSKARSVLDNCPYFSPEHLREVLGKLDNPNIMEWDDGEVNDLFSIEIKKVPLYDKV